MILCRVVTAATALVAVAVIKGKLDYDGVGAWDTIIAISSLCAMLPSSLTQTLLWKMSEAHGVSDYDAIRRLIRIGFAGILILAAVILPIVWCLRGTMVHGIQIPSRFVSQALWILPCVVGVTLYSALNDIMGVTISACQRTGIVTMIQAFALVVNYGVAIILLRLGFALEGLAIGLMLGAMVASVLYFRVAHHLCGGIAMIPALPSRQEMKTIGRYGGLLMVGYSSAALRDQTDKLVLANFANATWVGYYGIAARLAALVNEIAKFFYQPLVAAAGSMHSSKSWDGVQKIYREMIVIVGIAAGVITIVVAGLNGRIQIIWLGEVKPHVSVIILILLAGNSSALILTGPGTAICRAIGKVWIETSYVMINLVANLVLTIALVITVGPMGTVIASGSTWAISSIAFTFIMPRFVDMPADATRNSRWIFVTVAVGSAIAFFATELLPKAHGRLDAIVTFSLLGALYSSLFVGFAIWRQLIPASAIQKVVKRITRKKASGPNSSGPFGPAQGSSGVGD